MKNKHMKEDHRYGYFNEDIIKINFVLLYGRIYALTKFIMHVLDWHHFYLNQKVGGRLANKILQVCSWKFLIIKDDLSVRFC